MLDHFRPRVVRPAIVLLLCLPGARADAQSPNTPDVTKMSVQDLLGVEVVSTASKFAQEVKEAPASITVITGDEIRRYGHRTLADTLRSVRGFYTTYDRNYSYIGVRGFSRPGDYNTRVLLLIDGQRMNDPIYDMAPIGTDFPIDSSLIDGGEFIRGPGSSLYGTNAFFAVINVVTRTGARRAGLRADTHAGSLGTRGAAVSFGHLFGDGRELLLAGSVHRANGAKRLSYPEFDGDRLETVDNRAFLNTTYERPIGRGWSATARLAYDYYGYDGFYPIDSGDPQPTLSIDRSESHTASSEMTVRRRFGRKHLVTIGGEIRRQLRGHMSAEDVSGVYVNVDRPGRILGAYVQDEVRVFPWLLVYGGARIDRYPSFVRRAGDGRHRGDRRDSQARSCRRPAYADHRPHRARHAGRSRAVRAGFNEWLRVEADPPRRAVHRDRSIDRGGGAETLVYRRSRVPGEARRYVPRRLSATDAGSAQRAGAAQRPRLVRAARLFKEAAAILCGEPLTSLAAELEAAGERGRLGEAERLIAQIEAGLNQLRPALESASAG
jgi:outer membrane receptor protein involved in Fe transport